jgi:hypothetical protein
MKSLVNTLEEDKLDAGYIRLFSVVAILLLVSGCIYAPSDKDTTTLHQDTKEKNGPPSKTLKPHVVVALIDSGLNPYHILHRRANLTEHPSTFVPNYPKEAVPINITFDGKYHGTLPTAETTDACWKEVKHGVLYYIPSTNIIGAISFELGHVAVPLLEEECETSVIDETYHGAGTAGIIAQICPDAFIVMVQCGDFRKSIEWAANQSWIDVISISQIYYGDSNVSKVDLPTSKDVCTSISTARANGKLIIAGAGNRPYPSYLLLPAGHPDVISVGGAVNETKGEATIASKMPDFVSQFVSDRVATCDSADGYEAASGTSLSAPYASATVSFIILKLREALNDTGQHKKFGLVYGNASSYYFSDGMLTNLELRDVLNKSAIYWNITDYGVLGNINPDDLLFVLAISAPILPAPFLQMGWGYIGPEIVNDTVDILLGKKQYEPSLEKQLAEPYMNAIYELRKQFWTNWPLEN